MFKGVKKRGLRKLPVTSYILVLLFPNCPSGPPVTHTGITQACPTVPPQCLVFHVRASQAADVSTGALTSLRGSVLTKAGHLMTM